MDSTSSGEGDASLDALFSVLADEHCRRVLYYLWSAEGATASIDDLVDHVLAGDETTDDRRHAEVRFQHAILPKLEAQGYIERGARGDTVRYREDPLLERVLDLADEYET